ncbi:MAG: hypothetical protein ABJQ70_03525 [Roseobacter sp.]
MTKKPSRKIWDWLWFFPTLEAVVFGLLGAGLYKFSSIENLGLIFWSLGLIFVIHRVVSTIETKKLFSDRMDVLDENLGAETLKIDAIASIVDLSQQRLHEKVRHLNSDYLAITEPKLRSYKEKILDEAISRLSNLQHRRKTPILQELEFYNWLKKEFMEAGSDTVFEIVSMDEDLEWQDTPEEKEFLEANLAAARNGATINRIFVFEQDRMASAKENVGIFHHRVNARKGLNGFVVDSTSIRQKAPTAVEQAGQGFIIVNRQRVIVDRFEDGEARGFVTFEPSEVASYIEAYELISTAKSPLDFSAKAISPPKKQLQIPLESNSEKAPNLKN